MKLVLGMEYKMLTKIKQGLVKLINFVESSSKEDARMRVENFEAQHGNIFPEYHPQNLEEFGQDLREILVAAYQ